MYFKKEIDELKVLETTINEKKIQLSHTDKWFDTKKINKLDNEIDSLQRLIEAKKEKLMNYYITDIKKIFSRYELSVKDAMAVLEATKTTILECSKCTND